MKGKVLLNAVPALIAAVAIARAQDTAQNSVSAAQTATREKPVAEKHKVWTDDDLTPPRPVSANPVQDKDAPAAATSPSATTTKHVASSGPTQSFAKPALSNPKTLAEADKMIAWEDRDIRAQQEFVETLREQLAGAPADLKQHLEGLLQERVQILADLHRERESLITQRKGLEKKTAIEGVPATAESAPNQ